MKKYICLGLLSGLLFGCSASQNLSSLKKLKQYSGGERMGNAVSLFWYTSTATSPYSASDYVQSSTDGWYQTSYRWEGHVLKELIREGSQASGNQVSGSHASVKHFVPFRVHLRFDKNGEAVYQQYRVNYKVLPLSDSALARYKTQVEAIVAAVKKQDKQGLKLIQGVWNGEQFETCSGLEYDKVEFNQTLPSFVINRLSDLDNYMAFLGKEKNGSVYIEELLILADDGHGCIKRPDLIPES